MLVGLYLVYQVMVAIFDGRKLGDPAAELGNPAEVWRAAMKTLPAPLVLIIAVLGSILAGVATPTEAAGVGAHRRVADRRRKAHRARRTIQRARRRCSFRRGDLLVAPIDFLLSI